jgi:hypothetical protein
VSGITTVGSELHVAGNTTIAGDLTVIGSQTSVTIQSSTLEIGDNLIMLNTGPLGFADAGLLISRGTEAQYATSFYNTPENEFVFGYTTSNDTTGQVTLAEDSLSGQVYADVRLHHLNVHGDINMTSGTATLFNSITEVSTVGTGLFTGSVELIGTTISDASSAGVLVLSGGLGIDNTSTATSLTSGGALTISGGASIEKNAFIGSNLVVTTKDITPSLGDISREKSFAGGSNTTQDITGFAFSNSLTRAFNAIVSVEKIDTDSANNQYANYELKGLQKEGDWVLNSSYIGDNIGVTFAISNTGQVSYTSPNFDAGFQELDIRFKATTTSIYDVTNDASTIANYTGGTIVLSGANTPWTEADAEVYYVGNVGIGTTDPTFRLHVAGGNSLLDGYVTAGNVRVTGDLYVDGTINGDLQFDELILAASTIGNLIVTGGTTHGGHFVPSDNITYDLGSSSLRWRDLYLSGNTINLGDTLISSSADTISFGNTVLATSTTANVSTSLGGGVVSISNTTNAINATTGALVVAGGFGVAKDVHIGGSMTTGSINIDGSVIATALSTEGLDVTGTSTLSTATATALTTGGLDVTGAATLSTATATAVTTGGLDVTGAATLSSATATALTTGGLDVTGAATLSTATATALTTGGLDVTGSTILGTTTTGALLVSGPATIAGDLTVFGSQTNVDIESSTLEIADNLIKINAGPLGMADAGLLVTRGTTGNNYAAMFYDTDGNEFVFGYTDTDDTTGSISLSPDTQSSNEYASLSVHSLNARGDINMTAGTATLSDANVTTATMGSIYVSGNVGIGTMNPQAQLDLGATASSKKIALAVQTTDFWGLGANNSAIEYQVPSTSSHRFYTGSTTTALGTERMTISSAGNVGIGTANPGAKLHIQLPTNSTTSSGTGLSDRGIFLRGDGTPTGGNDNLYWYGGVMGSAVADPALFNDFSTSQVGMLFGGIGSTGTRIQFLTSNNYVNGAQTRMLIDNAGNVGIGRTDPAVPLDISGGGSIGTYSYHYLNSFGTGGASQNPSDVSVRSSGRMVASEFNAVSDERIKKDAAHIIDGNALEAIRLIQPKTYKYIDEVKKGDSLVYGFMAQEVEQVLPYAVKRQKDFLPSVYQKGTVTITAEGNSLITLESEQTAALPFGEGAGMLLYTENAEVKVTVKANVSFSSFEVLEEIEEQIVFVYGHEDDVYTLNKDSIFTVATAALQEVDRQLQAEKEAHQVTRNELAALATRVAVLETAE